MSESVRTDLGALASNPLRWKAMPIIALAVSVVIMDATVVNVVLPVIIRDIHLTPADAEWVNSVYALVFAALLITLGRWGDVHGRRVLLVAGALLFGVASVLAAISSSSGILIAARLLQGVGGAMILPATLSTVNALFLGQERGIAFAIWGSTIGGMAALGPVIGGWLTAAAGWHWAFLINVPIVIVIVVGILLWVPETRDPNAERGSDIAGNILSIVGLAALVFGLIEGQRFGWWQQVQPLDIGGFELNLGLSPAPIAFGLAIACLSAFIWFEQVRGRAGRPTLVDLGLFRLGSFRYGSIAALIVAFGEFGMLFALPLYVQGALGYSALATGFLILALAIGTFLVSAMTPQLTRLLGPRGVVQMGLAVEAMAVLLLGLCLSTTVSGWVLALWLFGYGAGVGMATAQLTSVILIEVPLDKSGQAAGLQSTVRQLGSALGIAVMGTLLVSSLSSNVVSRFASIAGVDDGVKQQATALVRGSAGADIPQLATLPGGSGLRQAAEQAMASAAQLTTLVAAAIIGLGLVVTLRLPKHS